MVPREHRSDTFSHLVKSLYIHVKFVDFLAKQLLNLQYLWPAAIKSVEVGAKLK